MTDSPETRQNPLMTVVTPELVQRIVAQFPVSLYGMHGVNHWARVLENGLALAKLTGAREDVVQLFAVFHDSRRINEGTDPAHGRRGADLAKAVRGEWFELDDSGMFALWEACAYHSDGLFEHSDPTVATCWDADRLDLGRVGIRPDPRKLCTDAARDPKVMGWAVPRGSNGHVPDWVRDTWGLAAPARP